ncbi:hypothetical protein BDZ89DRAFT_445225 [Hymenopellis radicata]|nr:hypothetical protein BDZ89DRAFT_445225 [Hymenopellis radicata]
MIVSCGLLPAHSLNIFLSQSPHAFQNFRSKVTPITDSEDNRRESTIGARRERGEQCSVGLAILRPHKFERRQLGQEGIGRQLLEKPFVEQRWSRNSLNNL